MSSVCIVPPVGCYGKLYAEMLAFPSPKTERQLEDELALSLLHFDLVGVPESLTHGMNLSRMSAYATILYHAPRGQ